MELTQLYQFKTVAECGQIKKASEKVFVSPPALSKAIRNLEEELGKELFIRTKNTIVLNEDGAKFLEYINTVFDVLKKAKIDMDVRKNIQQKDTRKYVLRTATSSPTALIHIIKCHPDITITTKFSETNNLEDLLLQKSIDIAVSLKPIINSDVSHIPLIVEQMMVCVPKGHPFYMKESVSVRDLHKQSFVRMLCDRGYFRNQINQLEKNYLININYIDMHCDDFWEAIKSENYLFLSSNLTMHEYTWPEHVKHIPFYDSELKGTHEMYFLTEYYSIVEPLAAWIKENLKKTYPGEFK